ncbi:MAG: prohibitin family protein [Candidatus Melainabacteria bacterium]|nr:prohibitin family protein [Candidatus Melainabacteria bacterium]
MDKDSLIAIGIAILVSAIFIFSGTVIRIVPAGHAGVVFNLFGGVEKRVLNEGINILFPIVETSTLYDTRKVIYNFTDKYERSTVGQSIKCQTNDGQKVSLDVSLVAHLDKDNVWKLHQKLGSSYVERLIVPQTRGITRNVVAKYPIDVVYTTGRTGLVLDVETTLRDSFDKSGIVLDDLLIRRVIFSPAFAEAVERKQIALQESQRQQWIKKVAEEEKKRKIIEGEGDAKSLALRGRAIMLNPQVAELEFLDELEKSGGNFTVVTGTKNAILSLGNFLQGSTEVGTIKKE